MSAGLGRGSPPGRWSGSLIIRKSPRLSARKAAVSKSRRVRNRRFVSGCMPLNSFLAFPAKPTFSHAAVNSPSFTIPSPLLSNAFSHASSMFEYFSWHLSRSWDSAASVSGSRSRKRMYPACWASRFFHRVFTSPKIPRRLRALQNSPNVRRPFPSRSSASFHAPSSDPQRSTSVSLKPPTDQTPAFRFLIVSAGSSPLARSFCCRRHFLGPSGTV
mmetsp:Transcript_7236/g.20266  ORF Transcript_7236/g.20266 Transcript_7236/m.20266 type:complete len:216 (-) Transcript_7236:628-1275(-)